MVSNARLDLPLPLGPVTTVSFPSGRSRSIPLRLFWRAPRISTQSFRAGAATPCFLPIFEPTGNIRCQSSGSQICRSTGILPAGKPGVSPGESNRQARCPPAPQTRCLCYDLLGALFSKARGEFFLLLEQFLRHDAA